MGRKISNKTIKAIQRLCRTTDLSMAAIGRKLDISAATVARYMDGPPTDVASSARSAKRHDPEPDGPPLTLKLRKAEAKRYEEVQIRPGKQPVRGPTDDVDSYSLDRLAEMDAVWMRVPD